MEAIKQKMKEKGKKTPREIRQQLEAKTDEF